MQYGHYFIRETYDCFQVLEPSLDGDNEHIIAEFCTLDECKQFIDKQD